jgi:uncharacterized membrane protein (DUF2068 family)
MTDTSAESSQPLPAPAANQVTVAHRPRPKPHAPLMLRLIAGLALLKTLLTATACFFVMVLSHHDVAETLNTWLRALNLDPDAEFLHRGVAWFAGIPVAKLRLAGVGFFIYAILYLAEAIGLWLDQTWAEWLTIVITGLLIPLEIKEMFTHITVMVTLLFVLNVAVVAYLANRVRRKIRIHHERKLAEAAATAAASAASSASRDWTGAPSE